MPDAVELQERPEAAHIHMIAGWRQWADAGSISSGLPQYLIRHTGARRIGTIRPDSFYLFQIPGTHDLVRPVIHFEDGFPQSLETPHNDLYYTGDDERGVVILLGDEPHLDIERYITSVLDVAQTLGIERIVSLGGVYGELPYNKERTVSANYSLPSLRKELDDLAVTLTDYHGGASIGSFLCRRAFERNQAALGLYAFVPTYDFSSIDSLGDALRLENDYMAWLGVMRRINYMLKTRFDLSELEERSRQLVRVVDAKVEEMDRSAPQLGIRDYLMQLAADFDEVTFDPLGDVWEEELRRLFDNTETSEDAPDD
jgi:proteasome assembly chaperone (PAC2) family protein